MEFQRFLHQRATWLSGFRELPWLVGSESNQASSARYLSGFIVGLETRELSGGFIELPSEFRELSGLSLIHI